MRSRKSLLLKALLIFSTLLLAGAECEFEDGEWEIEFPSISFGRDRDYCCDYVYYDPYPCCGGGWWW